MAADGGYMPLPGGDVDEGRGGAIRQPDFSSASSAHAHARTHADGRSLIATCPTCAAQLMIPPGAPTVACGACGQAISPIVSDPGGDDANNPYVAKAPPKSMVKCPLCAAIVEQPPGASLAICGGCHQVIAMPGDGGGGGESSGGGEGGAGAAGGSGGSMPGWRPDAGASARPPLIQCPRCATRLQPPPGAPLVACGECRQVMQVPGVQ